MRERKSLINASAHRLQVPAAYFLTIAPGIYRSIAAGKNFDRSQPRQALELCAKDPTMDKKVCQLRGAH